ncbi:hypothetical protein [Lysinibacillus parviboronicapiens]|uniref:hypothetical protein n=1 Tax=Lysinibacillus parviboronicapiens TaxID=436516 RepID=UPI000D34B506|nr:hypothetical protein [Lysinibacillus parviboronicapiens]
MDYARFFEFSEPYYALIMATSKEEAKKVYVENVADDEGDLEFTEVNDYYAVARFAYGKGEDGKQPPFNEILEQLKGNQSELLLIDASLI